MSEVKMAILGRVIDKILQLARIPGSYSILIAIVFFKYFVTEVYNPRIILLLLEIILFLIALAVIYKLRYDPAWQKIICLLISPLIGDLCWWFGNMFSSNPDMSSFVEGIGNTTRFGWLPVMLQWENIVPSFYFIAFFASAVYMWWSALRAVLFMQDKSNQNWYHDRPLQNAWERSLIIAFLVRSNLAFYIFSYLFSKLE